MALPRPLEGTRARLTCKSAPSEGIGGHGGGSVVRVGVNEEGEDAAEYQQRSAHTGGSVNRTD